MICENCKKDSDRVYIWDRTSPPGWTAFACPKCWPEVKNRPKRIVDLKRLKIVPLKGVEQARPKVWKPKTPSRKNYGMVTTWLPGQIKKIESLVDGVWVDTTKESEKYHVKTT